MEPGGLLRTGTVAALAAYITIPFVQPLHFYHPRIWNTAYKRKRCCLAGGKSFQWCYFSVYSNKYKDAFIFHKELLLLFESMLLQKQTSYF